MLAPPSSLPGIVAPPPVRRSRWAWMVTLVLWSAACDGDGSAVPNGLSPNGGRESPQLPPGAEAVSLLGRTLTAPPLSPEVRAQRERDLQEAEAALAAAPGSADALIWVGRRQAYLGRYRDAIATFTEGIRLHPEDARMYRHRGHRWITVRELDRAIEDFSRGTALVAGRPDEVEPDGMPNPLGIPTSTLHFNLWYHLGLAHYLKGDFPAALEAYRACMEVSTNPDARAATSYWLYLTLRRLGRDAEAAAILEPFGPEYEVIENQAYLDLLRLFRGDAAPEDLLGAGAEEPTLQGTTTAYGVGAWYLVNGDRDRALDIFRRAVAAETQWAAFGYIASEAELAREGN